MIFFDPWWNSAKDAATCSLWLSAAASCRVQRLGWLVKLYDPTFFFILNWWTCEEHDGPLVNFGAPLCTSFIKLCIGDMNLYQQYINIFLSDMFLTYNPHACLAKCQFVVSFWRWVRTYILCSYTTYTHCMYAYTGRYVHKHDNHKHMYIYICINNYI